MEKTESGISRYRNLKGGWLFLTKSILISIPVVGCFFILDIPFYLRWAIMKEQYFGLFLALLLSSIFLTVPPTQSASRERVPWYDMILSTLSFSVGLYLAIFYPRILEKLGVITPYRTILSTIAIFLILEGLRRLTGWILVSLALIFIFYARFTWLIPGIFTGPGIPWPRLSNYLFFYPNAMLGTPIEVPACIVFAFVVFGDMLFGVGGGEFLTTAAMSIFGRFRGGPAKMAVVASSLFGTISGSAVANVAATGVITIPLMKQTGYKPHIAGAVEAVASTGGQLMPPIMGAAAFIMADFINMPYRDVAIAAILPAILYYITVFVQVDLEAGKTGLRGLPRDKLPSLKGVLGDSYLFLIPLIVIIYSLFIKSLSPEKSALLGALSIFFLSFLKRKTRFSFSWLIEALEKAGRGLLEIGLIVATAGFIIGVIHYTGVGFLLTMSLVSLAGGNVYVLMLIIAGVGIILGMGMPTTAVYILLAVLLAPALVHLGIGILAAHLFVLYTGMLSMITPPVCLAAYAAGSIAGANAMRTGYSAMRLGIIAFIIPFLFVLSPALLLMGSLKDIISATVTAIIGCFFLGSGATGYLFQELSLLKRMLIVIAGIGLLIPAQIQIFGIGFITDIIGGGLGLGLVIFEWRKRLNRIEKSNEK